MNKWTRILYQPNRPLRADGTVTASKEHIQLSKEAAEEGMVLLKNEGCALPLARGERIALFGKGSFDYVKGGGGSGDVTVSYVHNLYDGFVLLGKSEEVFQPLAKFYRNYVKEQYKQGIQPGMLAEPEIPQELVTEAGAFADTAIVVISRFSGEGWDRPYPGYKEENCTWDRVFPDGDFFLTAEEKTMIACAKQACKKVIAVLNVGGVIDTAWIRKDDGIHAALFGGQGGMEGGLAMAEVLCGLANPSGKLADTWAETLEDYPSTANFHESTAYVDYTEDIYVGYRYFETVPGVADRVGYPFGYGLSYTEFDVETEHVWEAEDQIFASVRVTNTGRTAGKEVVQMYAGAPQGLLKKPAKTLISWEKTRLLQPGETQLLTLAASKKSMASYDDLGKVRKSAWVLEKGVYTFQIGTSVRDTAQADFAMIVEADTVVEQLCEKLAPTSLKKRMLSDGSYEELPLTEPNDPDACAFPKLKLDEEEVLVPGTRAVKAMPVIWNPAYKKQEKKQLIQVAQGKLTLDAFMAQLSDEDLISLLGGQPNTGVANTYGWGNLPEYGVPNVMTADGPAGLRINPECGVCTTAWPCATMLAYSWNPELAEQVGCAAAEEVKENNIGVWLAPAVNIHRNPLCGRNFEYYSEDPLVAGKTGAAVVRGIQAQHIAATVKHFAANDKETNRNQSDSRVSERALREIYLKAFEIIVKEADPWAIMSSYNLINGHRASENRELLEDVLRSEWGFQGVVTTDWWTHGEHYKEINAGNDIKMACGFPERVKKAMELGELDRAQLEHCARRVLELILKLD